MRSWPVLLLLVVVLLPALPASAHLADEFPQVTVQITIDDEAVELIVSIPAKDAKLAVFDGLSPVDMDKMEPADLSAMIGPVFALRCPVTIDGVAVSPVIFGAVVKMSNSRLPARQFPEAQVLKQGALQFLARYETKGPPRSTSVQWSIFANQYDEADQPIHSGEGLQVVGLVAAAGQEQVVLLTPEEPGYTWHAERVSVLSADVLASTPSQCVVVGFVPVLSIALCLLGSTIALVLFRAGRRGMWMTLGVTVVAALAASPFGRYELERTTSIARLSDSESLAVFESLHRNIYRAFDYTDEGAVYDALAQSVDGPMLETIYNDVYQSLIMREENGAVSKVVRVKIDKATLLQLEDDQDAMGELAYRVRCTWRVDGLVTHYGHSHARTNAFEAVYTVASRAEGWRIVDAEILQQRRVDDGQQSAEDLMGRL